MSDDPIREWIVAMINDGQATLLGPRGGRKKLPLPFDGSLIVSAYVQGDWTNDRSSASSLWVQLSDGDEILIDGGENGTFELPIAAVGVGRET